jgi:Pyruvate/2-oxoacid:ferredoxin oxidoreductase delta subunit
MAGENPVLRAAGDAPAPGVGGTLRSFACDMCSYCCASKGHLVVHQRTHSGEKPFGCDLCSYRCAVKSNLTAHQRTHSGEKPFGCDLCSYRCAEKSTLVLHQRTHSGEKPFGCELCSYRCARKTHLERHQRTHVEPPSPSLKRTAASTAGDCGEAGTSTGVQGMRCMRVCFVAFAVSVSPIRCPSCLCACVLCAIVPRLELSQATPGRLVRRPLYPCLSVTGNDRPVRADCDAAHLV